MLYCHQCKIPTLKSFLLKIPVCSVNWESCFPKHCIHQSNWCTRPLSWYSVDVLDRQVNIKTKFYKNEILNWIWLITPINPAGGRLRYRTTVVRLALNYIISIRPIWSTQGNLASNNNDNGNNKYLYLKGCVPCLLLVIEIVFMFYYLHHQYVESKFSVARVWMFCVFLNLHAR